MRSIWTKLADIVCFMGGAALTIYGLGQFNSRTVHGLYGGSYTSSGYGSMQVGEIAGGVSLIVLGFLIRSWTRRRADDFIK